MQDMLRAQKDKFTEVMAKTKTQMQDAVLRNDGAVAEAQAQSLALRSERDTLSVELQAVRETLEAVQEQVAKSREEKDGRLGKSGIYEKLKTGGMKNGGRLQLLIAIVWNAVKLRI